MNIMYLATNSLIAHQTSIYTTPTNPNVEAMPDIRITERQQKILNLIKTTPTITDKQMSESLSVSTRTIERDISALRKKGLIVHNNNSNDTSYNTSYNTSHDTSSDVIREDYLPSDELVKKLVLLANDDYMSLVEMQELVGVKSRPTFHSLYLSPAIADGALERMYPDKPKHPRQKYRLTDAANRWKKENKKE